MFSISAQNPPVYLRKPNFKQVGRQFPSRDTTLKDTYQNTHSFGQKTFY